MDRNPIVTTRLQIPQRCFPVVPRPSLLARLDEGLNYPLVLLSAPAGSGKTTLVCEWLETRRPKSLPVAWVSLDEGDNDLIRVWNSIFLSSRVFAPLPAEKVLRQLHTWQNRSIETILGDWMNELVTLPAEGILCLDDFHEIKSPQVQQSVHFLIAHIPSRYHLVILTRDTSGLPLARLRAKNHVCELAAADLRFTPSESRAFIQANIPGNLPAEAINRLVERTEGWAAGLRLAALALRTRPDPSEQRAFLDSLSGEYPVFQEYLLNDVIHVQPEAVQEFLLKTSLLDRLNGPLCDAITGQENGLAMLGQLEKNNLFLTPFVGNHEWYRYHSLFAEALRQAARRRYGETDLRDLALKASQWYEDQGLLLEAVEASHQGGSPLRAADLLERVVEPRLAQNDLGAMRRLIGYLPEEILILHPRLAFILAMAIFFTSNDRSAETIDLVEVPLQMAEASWRANHSLSNLGEALAFRSILYWRIGKLSHAFEAAKSALGMLPAEEIQWRSVSLTLSGTQALLEGKLSSAWKLILEAQTLSLAARNPHGVLQATHLAGAIAVERGDLDGAVILFKRALEQAQSITHAPNFEQGYSHLGLSAVAYERGELASARQEAECALDFGRQTADGYIQSKAALVLSRISFLEGDSAAAKEFLLSAITLALKNGIQITAPEILTVGARFCLAVGDIPGAGRWIEDWEYFAPEITPLQEQSLLTQARLQLAKGQFNQALDLLRGYSEQVPTQERIKNEIETKILSALAWFGKGDRQPARQALEDALVLAQPAGYTRVFLDEGAALFCLMQEILPATPGLLEGRIRDFYTTLLQAFSDQAHTGEHTNSMALPGFAANAIGTLSDQEERVLALLARGLSYNEIAVEMVLSVNTIKTHLKGVYRKLNLNSRAEARDLARRMKLV